MRKILLALPFVSDLWKRYQRSRTLTRDISVVFITSISVVIIFISILLVLYQLYNVDNNLHKHAERLSTDLSKLLILLPENPDRDFVRKISNPFLHHDIVVSITIVKNGKKFYFKNKGKDSRFNFYVQRKIKSADAASSYLQIEFSHKSLFSIIFRVILSILLSILGIILVVIYLARKILKRIVRVPINNLRLGILNISRGHYDNLLPHVRQKDIDNIIRSVNRLAGRIKKRNTVIEESYSSLKKINREFENKLHDLNYANLELEKSQKKYKHLIESTRDIIFSLDASGKLITVNQAVSKHLGYRMEDVIGHYIYELVYIPEDTSSFVNRNILKEKFKEIINNKKRIEFRMELRNFNNEPIEMNISLEYIPLPNDDYSVFGKATPLLESSLNKFIVSDFRHFEIPNYFSDAHLVSRTITSNLPSFLSEEDKVGVRFGIREILINAIEHGNLNISYNEKSKALSENYFFTLLSERQNDSRYKNRKVKIIYSLNSKRVAYLISDEGEGFNHKEFLKKSISGSKTLHGRGIHISFAFFDTIRYNGKGNKVLLVKRF